MHAKFFDLSAMTFQARTKVFGSVIMQDRSNQQRNHQLCVSPWALAQFYMPDFSVSMLLIPAIVIMSRWWVVNHMHCTAQHLALFTTGHMSCRDKCSHNVNGLLHSDVGLGTTCVGKNAAMLLVDWCTIQSLIEPATHWIVCLPPCALLRC